MSLGGFRSTSAASCNCDGFTQSGGSSPVAPVKSELVLMKKFMCMGCLGVFIVPVAYIGRLECEHDKFATGAPKKLIDIFYQNNPQ